MEEESASDDRRGPIEISRESVATVRGDSQRISWAGDFPSEIHVTSPGKAESIPPLHIDNNDNHSNDYNPQTTEYGWSAHEYPSVVNVVGIDDVSEMGFQSQNGDQSLRSAKTPIVYSQPYLQNEGITVELGSKTSEMISRMKSIKGRLGVGSPQAADNDSISPRNCMSVATGRAIVNGEVILPDRRDDLPLEVKITTRDDTGENRVQRGRPAHDLMERVDNVPGEVNVSLRNTSSLRYVQASYEESEAVCDGVDKERQEIEDSRELHPSMSSKSSRSTQSVYLQALSRRLSGKWKRIGVASKTFAPLTQSLSESCSISVAGQDVQFRNVDVDRDGPEIIDLNDYEDNDSQFLTKAESTTTDMAAKRENENEQTYADSALAENNDDLSIATREPTEYSEKVEQETLLEATAEETGTNHTDSCNEEESNENRASYNCETGDDQSLNVGHFDISEDTHANIANARGRENSRVSRAARKRRIAGRLSQGAREKSPLKTNSALEINKQEDGDTRISKNFPKNAEVANEECGSNATKPAKENERVESPKSHVVTRVSQSAEDEFDFEALMKTDDKKTCDQILDSTYQMRSGSMEVKAEEEKREELYNAALNGDNGTIVDRKISNILKIDKGKNSIKESNLQQPLALNLNISDYATTTSGSSGCEVGAEDLYVSSSNSEEPIEGREAEHASIGEIVQGHSSEDAEEIASFVYTNTSESDLEPEYDIYDQCVMPFIPKFLDTACAWLDGEEYGPRPRQSASSLLYKLQKKNVGQRQNNKNSRRSGSKTRNNPKGSRSLDLRAVSKFARPRRSTRSQTERKHDQDPPDNSLETAASSQHADVGTTPQPEIAIDGDQPRLESGGNLKELTNGSEPLRFTFSESKSSVDMSEPQSTTPNRTEKANRGRDPSVERQLVSPTAERSNNYGKSGRDEIGFPSQAQGGQASPFRKKLQERLESMKSRDTIVDEERCMNPSTNAVDASPNRLFSHSPLRKSQDPPNLSPRVIQSISPVRKGENSSWSPKQAEIVKISPRTRQTEREKGSPVNKPLEKSSDYSDIAQSSCKYNSSAIQDRQMATFRDGRLVLTAAGPIKTSSIPSQRETFAASSQGVNSESPFDESSNKFDTEAGQSFADKLRERNSKRISKAAGGPETLQGIRARRRMIEQKQFASSSRNRPSYEEAMNEPFGEEQVDDYGKTLEVDFKRCSPARRRSNTRSPSKRTERKTHIDTDPARYKSDGSESDSDAPADVIDADLAASLSTMNEDERNAALELVEKLRRRASTLKRRQKMRSRRLKNVEELQQQNFKGSLNDQDAYVTKQEWGAHDLSISAA